MSPEKILQWKIVEFETPVLTVIVKQIVKTEISSNFQTVPIIFQVSAGTKPINLCEN